MTLGLHRTLALVRRHARRRRSPRRCRITSPTSTSRVFAAAIERYRTLGLWGPDPVIRREGYDRLHAAMRAFGTLARDIAFETCVDTGLAERAVALDP